MKILVLDVETANTIDCALVYDLGWKVIDLAGKVYAQGSFVIRDVFVYMRELTKSAYYADKIPDYLEDIQNKNRILIDFDCARNIILNIMQSYSCSTVAAYNCSFDRNALNTTLRYITKSKKRYFFPHNIKFICIWNMACNTICQSGEYRTFSELHRRYSNKNKNYKTSAESVYSFITNNPAFEEAHKGLDDVNIECAILLECLKYENRFYDIDRLCWTKVKRMALALR